jgi:membrane associated rhomboid family serine protease
MDAPRTARLTPWVSRLLTVNAAVFVLLATVFTAPRFVTVLQFDPAFVGRRPWTLLSHLFIHGGLLHLALNSLALFAFGPPVERRMGGRQFITFYLYCGVGAALFALGASSVLGVEPFVGSSGALFGLVLAFLVQRPDADAALLPFPAPITARAAFGAVIAVDIVAGLVTGLTSTSTGLAHLAHLGGVASGYLFFRVQSLAVRPPAPRPTPLVRRPVVTPMRIQEAAAELAPAAPAIEHRPIVEPRADDEMDRVLDKISQFGIDSLTSEERQFLTDVAERKRKERH